MADEIDEFPDLSFSNISKELSSAFKEDPTIANYVRLRRDNPGSEIEVAMSNGLDWLFANEDQLREFGFEPALFVKTLDADPDAVSELSLQLLEHLIERKKADEAGKTHLASRGEAISDSLVNYMIAVMLDALTWTDDLYISRDLIVLVRHQLGSGKDTAIAKRLKSNDLELNAKWIGAELLERSETVSTRKVASILNVNASTISRMFPGNTLIEKSTEFLDRMKWFSKSETPVADIMKRRMKRGDPE